MNAEMTYTYDVMESINNGEALISVRTDTGLEAAWIVKADGEMDVDTISEGCYPHPGQGWPTPPQEFIDAAVELAQSTVDEDDEDEEGGHRVIAPATFGTHPSMGSDGRYEFDCAHCGDAVQYTGARLDNDYFEVGERVGYHDPVTGEDFCTDCEAKIYGSDDEEAEDE